MSVINAPADLAPAHCAVCGRPIDSREHCVTLAGGALAHHDCAGVDTTGAVAEPPRARSPRRLPDRLAHTSFPKRGRH